MLRRLKNKITQYTLASLLTIGSFSCNVSPDYWKTDFISDTSKQILEAEKNLTEKYTKEYGIEIKDSPSPVESPIITENKDSSYTLFYKTHFTKPSSLETIIKQQIPGGVISKNEETNQLIVNVKGESDIEYLTEIINKTDKMPSQTILELVIRTEYGDWTQDFAKAFNFQIGDLNGNVSEVLGDAVYPGASTRSPARDNMGSRYGININNSSVRLQATLDVLESLGFVKQVYRTTLTLSNNQKGSLQEEEKVPIPSYLVAGGTIVNTYNLEPVKSFFEVTPEIYDGGIIRLNLKAGLGSSKRPEGPSQFPVPIKDEVTLEGVYLRVGTPFIIAGKSNELELGVKRMDPIFTEPKSKDWERRTSRIWYEVTPHKIIIYENTPKENQESKENEPNNRNNEEEINKETKENQLNYQQTSNETIINETLEKKAAKIIPQD